MQSDDLGLASLLRSRIGVEFDGEAHLTEAEAQSTAAAIERLVAERDEARLSAIDNAEVASDWSERATAAEAQRDKLKEALKFYADLGGWKGRFEQDSPSSIMHHLGPVLLDRGARARQALGYTL